MEKVKVLRRENEKTFQTGKGYFEGTITMTDGAEYDFEITERINKWRVLYIAKTKMTSK